MKKELRWFLGVIAIGMVVYATVGAIFFVQGKLHPWVDDQYVGRVVHAEQNQFTLDRPGNDDLTVMLTPQTIIENGRSPEKERTAFEGKTVMVVGKKEGTVIRARAVRIFHDR